LGPAAWLVGKETAKVFIENGKLQAQPIIKDIQRQLVAQPA